MPELPEVETVRRGLEPVMTGQRFACVLQRRPDLRFPFPDDFAARLTGRTVTALTRRAKYILVHLDNGQVLIIHLGMSGRILIFVPRGDSTAPGYFARQTRGEALQHHDHVVFDLDSGARVVFNDTRRFGFMDLADGDALADCRHFKGLGVEPLGNEFGADYLDRILANRKTPIKAALLDQRLIAGLGNIYVCEVLFRSGISPRRVARTVPGKCAERLAPLIREVLNEAIAAGGSTLRDYVHTDGELGYFQRSFAVYGREGEACPTCGGVIERIVQSGRSTFLCPKCQR